MTTMHTAQVAGVCVEDGTVTLTVCPLKVAPATFAGDVMGWSLVRVGAEALPQEADAGTPPDLGAAVERLNGRFNPPASPGVRRGRSDPQLVREHAAKALSASGCDVESAIAWCKANADDPRRQKVPPKDYAAYVDRQLRVAKAFETGHYTACADTPGCTNPAVSPAAGCGRCESQLVDVRAERLRRQNRMSAPVAQPQHPTTTWSPQPELMEWARTVVIQTTYRGNVDDARLDAYEWSKAHRLRNGMRTDAYADVPRVVIDRWTVNYLRHHYTNYGSLVRGKPQGQALDVLRERANALIVERYKLNPHGGRAEAEPVEAAAV